MEDTNKKRREYLVSAYEYELSVRIADRDWHRMMENEACNDIAKLEKSLNIMKQWYAHLQDKSESRE